jgi:hypothetical protein
MLMIAPGMVLAQEDSGESDSVQTGWKISMVFDLTGTQSAYSNSWAGSEVGSFSWVSNFNSSAEKQLSPSFYFSSKLRLSFGQIHSQKTEIDVEGNENTYWEKPKKSADLIDWDNVGRLTKGWKVDPYIALRLESQFLDESFEPRDRYFNPLRLTESAGVTKTLHARDKDEIISRFGFALRQTFKNVIVDTASITSEDSIKHDGGLESVTDTKLTFHENVLYSSKLTLYWALFYGESDQLKGTPQENYWKAIDVNWENYITANITKILAVNFYLQLLYDKQQDKRVQFKETLGFGVSYKLM